MARKWMMTAGTRVFCPEHPENGSDLIRVSPYGDEIIAASKERMGSGWCAVERDEQAADFRERLTDDYQTSNGVKVVPSAPIERRR